MAPLNHLTFDLLCWHSYHSKGRTTAGVDRVRQDQYEASLESNPSDCTAEHIMVPTRRPRPGPRLLKSMMFFRSDVGADSSLHGVALCGGQRGSDGF